jgi:hypothetical protein
MTPAEHEARIDRMERGMLAAQSPEERRGYGQAFVLSVLARNFDRTPEQVAEIEHERGLR